MYTHGACTSTRLDAPHPEWVPRFEENWLNQLKTLFASADGTCNWQRNEQCDVHAADRYETLCELAE